MATEDSNQSTETQAASIPDTPKEKPTNSLRETLERNSKEPERDLSEIDGTAKEPAKGKSFVNDEVQKEQPEAPKEVVQYPGDMNPEERKAFEAAPVETQKYLARRALDARRQITEAYQVKQQYAEYDRIVPQELKEEFARERTSAPQILENSIAWHKAFKANPTAAAIEFLKAENINLDDLYQGYKSGELYKEPEVKYLTAEEARAEAEKVWQEKEDARQQLSIVTERETALHSFLSNPLFQDSGTSEQRQIAVAKQVRILQEIEGFQGTPQQVLDKALEKAIAMDESFSSARQQATASNTNIHEQMQRVRDAKKASRSITGSLGSGSPVQKTSSLRENLMNNWVKS